MLLITIMYFNVFMLIWLYIFTLRVPLEISLFKSNWSLIDVWHLSFIHHCFCVMMDMLNNYKNLTSIVSGPTEMRNWKLQGITFNRFHYWGVWKIRWEHHRRSHPTSWLPPAICYQGQRWQGITNFAIWWWTNGWVGPCIPKRTKNEDQHKRVLLLQLNPYPFTNYEDVRVAP